MLVSVLISLLTVGVLVAIAVDRRSLAPVPELDVARSVPGTGSTQRPIERLCRVRNGTFDRLRIGWGAALVALAGSLALVLWGQWRLVESGPDRITIAIWLLGLAGTAGLAMLTPVATANARDLRHEPRSGDRMAIAQIDTLRLLLGVLSLVTSIAVWRLVGPRESGDHVNDVLMLWVLGMVSLVLAVGGAPSRSSLQRLWAGLNAHRREVAIVALITIAALMLRVFPYGGYPRTMSGDEGVFAMQALEVTAGNLNNYFAVVNTGNINFTFAVLSGMMSVFGETVGGARLFSAVAGTLAVLPTYALARLHFGRFVATLSAAFLTVSYFALFWSRNAMNETSAFLFAPLTLWLLDQGLLSRRRTPALLAGFSVGLSLLFYSSSRILMPIALLYCGYAVCSTAPRSLRDLISAIRSVAPYAILVVAGFFVSAMPILSHFWHHPGSFNHRANQVSVFASGWLDREVEISGESAPLILFDQFREAALVPFGNQVAGIFIHRDPPLLGWPVVLPAAIGIAIVTLTFWRRQHFGFAALFWATAAGTAITIGPSEPHKLVTSISILAILAAVAIVAIARVLLDLIRAPRLLVAACVTGITLSIVIWNLGYYFGDPDRDADFSDPSTQIAQSIADRAGALGPETTVYLLGAPWMYYGGFNNFLFIARDANGIDLVDPLTNSTPPPELTGPTMFAVLGGREGELEVIREWFPGGIEIRHTWPDWGYLYTTYTVFPETTAGLVDAPVLFNLVPVT